MWSKSQWRRKLPRSGATSSGATLRSSVITCDGRTSNPSLLPPLPSLEPDASTVERCPTIMDHQCILPLEGHANRQEPIGGVSIQEPVLGAVIVGNGEQGANVTWAVISPLKVARARLHEERHWIVHHSVALVHDGDGETGQSMAVRSQWFQSLKLWPV